MGSIQFRSATYADLPFAFEVMESAMRVYAEQTWGPWDSEKQRQNHQKSFVPKAHRLVLVEQAPVGIVALEEHSCHLQLEKLYLLPAARNRGFGSEILLQLPQRARVAAKPVRLRVLAVNKPAQRFYVRHGFCVVSITTERIFMEWSGV